MLLTILLTAIISSSFTFFVFPRPKQVKHIQLSSSDFNHLYQICKEYISIAKKYDGLKSIDNKEIIIGTTSYKKDII